MNTRKTNRSYTLIELVIVVAIIGIFAMLMYQVLDNGLRSWRIQNSHSEIREDSRGVLDRIVREIRQASTVSIPSGNQIAFTYDEDRDGLAETFSYQTSGNFLQRTRISITATVLANVTAFSVTGLIPGQPWVTLSISATGREGIIHNYRTSVYPRRNLP